MKYACKNCLEPVDCVGALCPRCRDIAASLDWWYGVVASPDNNCRENYLSGTGYSVDGIDRLQLQHMKKNRMASYKRARRMARGQA